MKNFHVLQLFIIILLASISCQAEDAADLGHKVKIGDPAPIFNLEFTDSKIVALDELKGKVVMLQFTASWCSVCIKEMPFIESEIWQQHKDNPEFELFAVDLKEDIETINKFREKTKITYPVLLDTDRKIFEMYADKDAGVTRNVIIDKTGKIRFLTRLFNREEFDEMKKVIDKLLLE